MIQYVGSPEVHCVTFFQLGVDTCMRFEVVMQSNMEDTLLWIVMPCSLVDRYQHFGGICCLCQAGRRALNFQALHPVFVCRIFITEAVSQYNEVPYTIFVQVSTVRSSCCEVWSDGST
jgi:hypothetical protein